MRSTANTSEGGRFCGRAVHGVSSLSNEDLRQIEAHRSRARPTPWPHLAMRYRVNEIDLRQLFQPKNDNTPEPSPEPEPESRSLEKMLPALWSSNLSLTEISAIMGIDDRSIQRMRVRIGLRARKRGQR